MEQDVKTVFTLSTVILIISFTFFLSSQVINLHGYVTIGTGSKVAIVASPVLPDSGGGGTDGDDGGGGGGGSGGGSPDVVPGGDGEGDGDSTSLGDVISKLLPEQIGGKDTKTLFTEKPIKLIANLEIGLDIVVVSASLFGVAFALFLKESLLREVMALIEEEEQEEVAEKIGQDVKTKLESNESTIIQKILEEWNSFRRLLPR